MALFATGKRFLTRGGWKAVICWEEVGTVFHEINGGVLYTHSVNDGSVKSGAVGIEYDLEYELKDINDRV